jgi:hypothetical protein
MSLLRCAEITFETPFASLFESQNNVLLYRISGMSLKGGQAMRVDFLLEFTLITTVCNEIPRLKLSHDKMVI